MKRFLFIDRDGTLVQEPADFQVDSKDKVVFMPGVIGALARICRETTYELVMVTNQDGLGTPSFPEADFWPAHQFILDTLAGEGIHFSAIHIDRSFPHEEAPTRKPRTGMLEKYLGEAMAQSWVIGDRRTDMELARNLGARGIVIGQGMNPESEMPSKEDPQLLEDVMALKATHWAEIADFLCSRRRPVTQTRNTAETQVAISLNLDGRGNYDNQTGIGFFDHLLDQLARHGAFDLSIRVSGDLHIDAHHTIEDTALTLGEAFRTALGDKRGIGRYGFFLLPMDETLAQVALDFGGRPWLVWDLSFGGDKVGDFPLEMVHHFFKSFADAAACNLNIAVQGSNDHHLAEALFKCFARALRMAVRQDSQSNLLPSTKGTL